MDRVFLVFLILFSLLLFLLASTVRLFFSYSRLGCYDRFVMEFSAWQGLIYYHLEIPAVKLNPKKKWPLISVRARLKGRVLDKEKKAVPLPKLLKSVSKGIRTWREYRKAIDYLLNKAKLLRFTWRTELGMGDPAQTALLTGAAWGVKGFILTIIYRLLTPGGVRPVVEISPSFKKVCFNTTIDCIFEVRLGYLVITGFKALVIKFK